MHYFIERMMSKDKDLRFSTPRELVEDITQQIEGFKSLEYHPEGEEEEATSTVMGLVRRPDAAPATTRRLRPPPPTTRKLVPPTTRRISKLEEYRNRSKKK